MKRPTCMEKRILVDVPVVYICPKCGGEEIITYTFVPKPEWGNIIHSCEFCGYNWSDENE
jgi:predicted RNA-binding Zn-ribbon protein involved in translation (DUF1610 family)